MADRILFGPDEIRPLHLTIRRTALQAGAELFMTGREGMQGLGHRVWSRAGGSGCGSAISAPQSGDLAHYGSGGKHQWLAAWPRKAVRAGFDAFCLPSRPMASKAPRGACLCRRFPGRAGRAAAPDCAFRPDHRHHAIRPVMPPRGSDRAGHDRLSGARGRDGPRGRLLRYGFTAGGSGRLPRRRSACDANPFPFCGEPAGPIAQDRLSPPTAGARPRCGNRPRTGRAAPREAPAGRSFLLHIFAISNRQSANRRECPSTHAAEARRFHGQCP